MILFTPHPPQMAFTFTLEQMARLDRRFACLPPDPTLLVQDSALLLGGFLTLRLGHHEWRGPPDVSGAFPPLTEAEWAERLGLGGLPVRAVGRAELGPLRGWTDGVVYTFADRLIRHYPLGDELGRLELHFLLQAGLPGVRVLRAGRLGAQGELTLWRAAVGKEG